MAEPKIESIQEALAREGLDGWLFYNFHGVDPIGPRILGLPAERMESRRWFCLVPRSGTVRKLVHGIEAETLDAIPGEKRVYVGWRKLEEGLAAILSGMRRVAMQYSPLGAIPYVSRVDAGTLELVRATGVEVVTSADLVSWFESRLTDEGRASHDRAAGAVHRIVHEAFAEIGRAVDAGTGPSEHAVQQFIMRRFRDGRLVTDHPPIVAVGPNSGKPHFAPSEADTRPMRRGDFVLIDLWAREEGPDAIFADITWTGFIGREVPDRIRSVFEIVRDARNAGIARVREAVAARRPVTGAEVDDATRAVIESRGFGDRFIHRTGHSIGREVHGNGANIDNLETRDGRRLLERTLFSIEPGIYLEEFGVRSEVDVWMGEGTVEVTGGPPQDTLVLMGR